MIQRKSLFKKVKTVVHDFDPDAKILLFGSRARGDNRKDSDWDFMIITNKKFDWQTVASLRNKFYYDVELTTDVALYTTVEYKNDWEKYKNFDPFYQNVAIEGIEI
jgi:predicted nucleotidyltransferase